MSHIECDCYLDCKPFQTNTHLPLPKKVRGRWITSPLLTFLSLPEYCEPLLDYDMALIFPSVNPSTFNVIKFIVIALFINPLLELLVDSITRGIATYNLLRGHAVILSDSKLGFFSLHGTFSGRKRNRAYLVALAIVIITMELLLEFSFSSTTIDVGEQQKVWLQPNHSQRYIPTAEGSRVALHVNFEPTGFIEEVSRICTDWTTNLRSEPGILSEEDEIYDARSTLDMEMTFQIRKPYIHKATGDVCCGIDQKQARANFFVPHLGKTNGSIDVEGHSTVVRSKRRQRISSMLNKYPLLELNTTINAYNGLYSARASERASCVNSSCIAIDEHGTFTLFTVSTSSNRALVDTIDVVARGEALSALAEKGRQIRLLLALLHQNFQLVSHSDPSSLLLIHRTMIQHMAIWMVVAANEEGVGGIEEAEVNRTIVTGRKTVASATSLVTVSMILLASVAFLLFSTCLILQGMIATLDEHQDRSFWQRCQSQWRLQTSKQDMRQQLVDDLRCLGVCALKDCKSVSIRMMRDEEGMETMRLLPDEASEAIKKSFRPRIANSDGNEIV
eukprot:TRINITY_DN50_c0_g2_i1.p1 TRINITY_DN50_c0_g2~~TRINITY_DN50_c0_g2_i1.p1  ORF type:complete len:561 (+),score=52.32 TRINITY_DN50_c0_g2_i1:389-2071(+)